MKTTCAADGCPNNAEVSIQGKRYCNKHYLRIRTHGTTELPPRKRASQVIETGDGTAIIKTAKGDEIIIDSVDAEMARNHSWCLSVSGYPVSRIDGRVVRLHRHIMDVTDKKTVVDHKDGNPLNNKRSNLRVCTAMQNAKNLKKKITNTSGYTGIRKTDHGRFNARITVNRKEIHIGNFETIEEAKKARIETEKRLHGEFGITRSRRRLAEHA